MLLFEKLRKSFHLFAIFRIAFWFQVHNFVIQI